MLPICPPGRILTDDFFPFCVSRISLFNCLSLLGRLLVTTSLLRLLLLARLLRLGLGRRLRPLDALVLDGQRAQDRARGHGGAHVKHVDDALVVRLQHARQVGGREDGAQLRRARVDDLLRGQAVDACEPLHEVVLEHVLTHGNEDGGAEGLDEEDERYPDGGVLFGEDGLHRDVGLLEAAAHAEAEEDLHPDPHRVVRRRGEERQQPHGDGGQDGRQQHRGLVVAHPHDDDAGADAPDHHAEEHGDGADARADGRVAFDGLEPDGQVVEREEKGATDEEDVPRVGQHATLPHDAGREGG